VSRIVSRGQTNGRTDRHDDANSRFRNFANKPKIEAYIKGDFPSNSEQ
jgi:hypothetical protein